MRAYKVERARGYAATLPYQPNAAQYTGENHLGTDGKAAAHPGTGMQSRLQAVGEPGLPAHLWRRGLRVAAAAGRHPGPGCPGTRHGPTRRALSGTVGDLTVALLEP